MSKNCQYCGNNPVPHFMQWASQSLIILMMPINIAMAKSGVFRRMSRFFDMIFAGLWGLFAGLGWATFNTDREKSTINRAKVLWEEADRRGIAMKGGRLFGRELDYYCATVNGKDLFFTGLPRPLEYRDSEAEFWMDDKAVLKDKLEKAGLPTARGGSFSDYGSMLKEFHGLEKPVIVKPRLGSRGRHTTTFIFTEDHLRQAFNVAKKLCHWVVMEEHLVGDVFRGTVIGGKLAGVLGGSPPRITGDGVHTIRELVDLKNANKDPRVKDIKISDATLEFLSRNGLAPESILPIGRTIDMTEKIGISYGGTSFEITDETHPEIKIALEKAAAIVGDPLLGFDFIIEDVRKTPIGQKWGIIECNGMPFINLHHQPLLGKPNNVAKYVWDLHQ